MLKGYPYEKGLLSYKNFVFEENINELLFQSKFRLLNGESDFSIYPDKVAYAPAVKVVDYSHFAKTTRNVSPLIERKVLKAKRIMSIDERENLYFALIYISLITAWVVLVLRRSMQKGISYAAFFTGVILNGWTCISIRLKSTRLG